MRLLAAFVVSLALPFALAAAPAQADTKRVYTTRLPNHGHCVVKANRTTHRATMGCHSGWTLYLRDCGHQGTVKWCFRKKSPTHPTQVKWNGKYYRLHRVG